MDRAEITERITTRRNQRPDDEITLSRTHDVALGDGYMGEITVEYKPREYRLTEDAFHDLAYDGFFSPDFDPANGLALDVRPVEKVVADLYCALVDLLFPGSSYLDEPWTTLPLVVEIEYSRDDTSKYYASLGTYR